MRSARITIIGAGISGITTALHLREAGYETTLVAPLFGNEWSLRDRTPAFASLFPAACILPHTVEMERLTEVFDESQQAFSHLASLEGTGIRWQRHYEFQAGAHMGSPEYAHVLRDFHRIGEDPSDPSFGEWVGHAVSGWGATVLFAEMETYVTHLLRRYQSAGGTLERRSLSLEELTRNTTDAVVNCSGLWSGELFGDPNLFPIRGDLTLCREAPFPPMTGGPLISYNYTPLPAEYRSDVYFFPRADGWLLGGSRDPGRPDGNGGWVFPEPGIRDPSGVSPALLSINRRILLHLCGTDILSFPRTTFGGFRPARKGGVRLEPTSLHDLPVIHNYGHGGAGVAMSWGCAFRVRALLSAFS